MKTILLIMFILVSLYLTVSSGRAQGNLLVNTNWIAQPNTAFGVVYPIIASNGDFSVIFSIQGGSISQIIPTTPGSTYDLTFQAIQYQGTTASSVSINGNLLANFTPDDPFVQPNSGGNNTVWYNFDYDFSASSANTTISFTEDPTLYPNPDGEPYSSYSGLDSISVTQAPEPSAMAFLGAGLVGWLACNRRKRLKT